MIKQLFERRRIAIIGGLSIFLIFSLLLIHQNGFPQRLKQEKDKPEEAKPPAEVKPMERPAYIEAAPDSTKAHNNGSEKLAYVIFLADNNSHDEDLENDRYLQATRTLVWQLKHKPATRTKHDVVVMVAPGVTQPRRERLRKDGAKIHAVEVLHTQNDTWITYDQLPRFSEVLTKLRIWQMTEYDRILMLDGDSMILKNLDGVFDDPASKILKTKPHGEGNFPLPGMAPIPDTYLMASLSEVWDSQHSWPPKEGHGLKNIGMFNAGFFMIAPSLDAFKYYTSMLDIPNSFDPIYPEQNLMNKAHEWSGRMPWRELDYKWNVRCPTEHDFANGLVSLHEKWWEQNYIYGNQKVKDWLRAQRWEMKGWYDAMDLKLEELQPAAH